MNMELTILLVEDDQATCVAFIECIEELDDISIVRVTNNSEKAVEYIKDFLPDVLILDLELHEGSGNGLIVLQELKNLCLDMPPYVLVTTNNSSAITYEAARKLGADFIMSKHQKGYSENNVVEFLRLMRPMIQDRWKARAEPRPAIPSELREKRMVRRINSELNAVGISPKMVGYTYLQEAIALIIKQPVSNLCNILAEKHRKTESSVERAMQNAINKAWHTADIDDLLRCYTAKISSDKGVPTLTEFIYYYANKLKSEY